MCGEGIEWRKVGAKDFTNSNYSSGLSRGSSIIKAAQINVYDQHEEKNGKKHAYMYHI